MYKVLLLGALLFIIGCGDKQSDQTAERVSSDNALFDSMNSSHKAAVLGHVRPTFTARNPDVFSFTSDFQETSDDVTVRIVWEDHEVLSQVVGQEDTNIEIIGGTWQMTIDNDELEEILGE